MTSEADGRWQARSMVISRGGVVASEHPLASQAGAQILARGGHAVDAAIAANAVLGVVAPHMNGVGGDLFAIVSEAGTPELHGLNASGWSGSHLTSDFLRRAGTAGLDGVHAVTVPGAVAGWAALNDRFGKMPWRDLLAPAIQVAEEGFPVAEWTASDWAGQVDLLAGEPNAASTFLPGGHAPRVGQVFRNRDLARTLQRLASEGADALYRGEIGARILSALARRGAAVVAEDLSEYEVEWAVPVATDYRGWTVYELPPNGVGIAALEMLNIVERYPMQSYEHNSAAALHVLIEAKKLAYADLARHVADPRFAGVPTSLLISKAWAETRGQLIAETASPLVRAAGLAPSGGDTVYLNAVDRQGNIVSLIQSIYGLFGSGIVPDGAGFALQNRGALFNLDPAHPNAVGARKRPQHTIIPALMVRGDQRIAFGIMGGWNQSQAHAQFVSNVVDHGMNIQAALEAARFNHESFVGCEVSVEERVPEAVRAQLGTRGHVVRVRGSFSGIMGGGQAVLRDGAAGVNYGASDPRKDGAAIPEPIGS
jgi:gamma-glutamyltranspeptidase/glutathione hydrolase